MRNLVSVLFVDVESPLPIAATVMRTDRNRDCTSRLAEPVNPAFGRNSKRPVSSDLPDLAIVERTIASGFRLLRFPPALEQFFEAENAVQRGRDFALRGLLSLVLFDLFLFADAAVTPDVLATALLLRLAIVTPVGLIFSAATIFRRRLPPVWLRESLVVMGAALCSVTALVLMGLSTSPYRLAEHFVIVLIVLFATIMQRTRFPYAVLAVVICLGVHEVMLHGIGNYPGELVLLSEMIVTGAAVLALFAAYSLERESRLTYLITLRGRLLNNELADLSRHDPLTGLANRRVLDSMLADLEARGGDSELAVLLFDVDHFKLYNDTAGHQAGDVCLKRVATLMRAASDERAADVFRFGGEEFLVLLSGMSLPEACRLAERVRHMIELDAIPHPSLRLPPAVVTVSAGVAAGILGQGTSTAEIIAGADAALYAAKRSGRNQVWPRLASAGAGPSDLRFPAAGGPVAPR